MLVDINLLPEKEKKRSSLFILILFALLLVAAIGGYSWLTYNQQVQEEKRLQLELASTQQLKELLQENKGESDHLNAAEQLEKAIDWAENYPISTSRLLRHIASLLPERGFVLNFSYQDTGESQLSVQFDSSREAAYFLKSLQDSKFVNEASLLSISTESAVSGSDAEKVTDGILPRYIAQYILMVDKGAVKDGEGTS